MRLDFARNDPRQARMPQKPERRGRAIQKSDATLTICCRAGVPNLQQLTHYSESNHLRERFRKSVGTINEIKTNMELPSGTTTERL